MGLVSDVFSETVLAGLPGDVAIGHTRYSTAGSSVLVNAQPILAGYTKARSRSRTTAISPTPRRCGPIWWPGLDLPDLVDSEVLIHLIARSEAREPEDQLLDALERVEGAYRWSSRSAGPCTPSSIRVVSPALARQTGVGHVVPRRRVRST